MQALLLDELRPWSRRRRLAARPWRFAGAHSHRRHPPADRMNLSAVILAGGESRRMGKDKGWLEVDGQPLLARALSTLRDSGINEILISGRAGIDYSSLHYPVLLDLEPGCGPLSGIERALEAARAPLLLVLAVDLPN